LSGTLVENFNFLHAFSFNPVFGENILDFVITDTGPPTAFRVDGFANAVPEPGTLGDDDPRLHGRWLLGLSPQGQVHVSLRIIADENFE